MRNRCIRVPLLSAIVGMSSLALAAQSWDAASQARSWAKQDKDDSFTFFDPAARMLHTWTRDGGLMGSLPLARLDETPERWLLDPRNNAWVAHGAAISQFDRNGRNITTVKLPAEVGDVCWDTNGFILSYRTPEPYLEKRDFKGKEVLWSFGAKPGKNEGPPYSNRRPIIIDFSGHVLMADGRSLNLAILDSETGRKLGETTFSLSSGQPAPFLDGDTLDRRPLAIWPGKGVVFAALKASQIPRAQRENFEGLLLARLDRAQSTVEFLPTGLDESHTLVGVLDGNAVFASPKGGLMLVKVQ